MQHTHARPAVQVQPFLFPPPYVPETRWQPSSRSPGAGATCPAAPALRHLHRGTCIAENRNIVPQGAGLEADHGNPVRRQRSHILYFGNDIPLFGIAIPVDGNAFSLFVGSKTANGAGVID